MVWFFFLRSLSHLFADVWHLLQSCTNHSPMARGFVLRSVNSFVREMLTPLNIMQTPFSNGRGFVFEKFELFCSRIVDPPEKHENPPPPHPPEIPRTLGPYPDNRAQNSVQDSLNESSVRPNPTLVFIKILVKIPRSQF